MEGRKDGKLKKEKKKCVKSDSTLYRSTKKRIEGTIILLQSYDQTTDFDSTKDFTNSSPKRNAIGKRMAVKQNQLYLIYIPSAKSSYVLLNYTEACIWKATDL